MLLQRLEKAKEKQRRDRARKEKLQEQQDKMGQRLQVNCGGVPKLRNAFLCLVGLSSAQVLI